MAVFIVKQEDLRTFKKLTTEITKNQFVIHLPDTSINYAITNLGMLVITSETFGKHRIDFKDPCDCVMTKEYAILAELHNAHQVRTGEVIHLTRVIVNYPDGEYFTSSERVKDVVYKYHEAKGLIFTLHQNTYNAVGDMELTALHRRTIRPGVYDAIPDDYLFRIMVDDTPKYVPFKWCYKNTDLAVLMVPPRS